MTADQNPNEQKRIVVRPNGPYRVEGEISLARKRQVVSEYGEPLTWQKEEDIETSGTYFLCRCGGSGKKPFCDGSHKTNGFDGTETADTRPTSDRQVTFEGEGIVVKRDYSLCTEAGFCATRFTDIEKMTPKTGDTQLRSLVMAMIDRCPSGSYTYSIQKDGADVEADLPQQIAVTTEILSDGPIPGPLWVTGNIPVERSDGQPLETRNRVTLCNCGRSGQKPLCDGTHRKPKENA